MHLKKIHISGFKSFADKVSLTFDKGITGIVGPNGSGKSNVIDAVRWVMGEQNAKHLRGEVATDIIFAGSEKRKSLALAEVTLVFDNQDQSPFCPAEYRHEPEISLTRRLYIDGEREYLINRKACRLKDIVSFFAVSGLGGRSYSMIQQGQVDRVLNAKPEDVREILEEAAGTLVYKNKRLEALKKLEMTNENMSRLEDIVSELARQQDALQGQMEKAMKWQDLTDQLRAKELSLMAHNFHHFSDLLIKLQDELSSETQEEATVIANLAHFEARQAELQQQLDDSDPGLEGLHEGITAVREQIARGESTIMSANNRLEQGQKRRVDLDREIDGDQQNLVAIETQVEAATTEVSTAAADAERLQNLIDSFQDQVDAVDEEAQVFQNRIEDSEDELRNIDRLLESNGLRCEAIERERQRHQKESHFVSERLETLGQEIATAKKSAEKAGGKVSEQQEGLSEDIDLKAAEEAATIMRFAQIKEISTRRDDLREKYINAKARCTSLEELEASAGDVAGSLANLRKLDATTDDLTAGLLLDFLSFKKDAGELTTKTTAIFEKWAERLVVADLNHLNDLIRLAHKHNAASLPVTVLSELSNFDDSAAKKWADANDAEPMASYLKISKKVPGIDQLIDRLYFLPSLSLSPAELSDLPTGIIVFTSQGMMISQRTEFTIGGRTGTGFLGRRQELDDLGKALKEHEKELAAVQGELDQLEQQQHASRLIITEVDEKLRSQNQDVLAVMSELQSANQAVAHKIELLEAAKAQMQTFDTSERELINELGELGKTRISLGTERERVTEDLENIRTESESIEERRSEVMRQHQQRKLDLAKSEARANALQQSFAQTQSQLERLQNALSRRYEEKSRLEQELEAAVEDEKRCQREIADAMVRREQLEGELAERREENAGILEEMRVIDAKLKDGREQLNKIQKATSERNIEQERLKLVIASTCDQAQEKYHIQLDNYEFERLDNFKPDSMTREVQKLRGKIEDLGGINMMAIQEYNALMERKNFIETQRGEVISSMTTLQEAIAEIEVTSKEKFLATFATINAEFGSLFPILFPGGEARLEMANAEDPLNSGVEIMVRMPGKARQRMNLYSGGEKALTAISLIFALLKTKPTPFCFLDEVDAPLDEANVGRYNKVLEALSERFQFIVITHNRRTMEVLDTLYGVTMQEPGVSKIVGVDMQKDLPAHLKKAFKEEGAAAIPRPPEGTRTIEGATAE